MGQLLVVQSRKDAVSDSMWHDALAVFEEFISSAPIDEMDCGAVRAVKCPRVAGISSGVFRDALSGWWAAGAGTWFYDGASGTEGLKRFCAAIGGNEISDSVLGNLDGSFAIILGRSGESGFHVITDRIGTIHIYVAATDGIRLVSTSSAALAGITGADHDECGCREFLATGTVFEHRTLFRNIEKIGPATLVYFPGDGEKRERIWWRMRDHMFDADSSGSVERVADALEESVSTVLGEYPNAVFDLTGGYDSRAVLAAALRTRRDIATVVNGGDEDPDVIAANRIAAEFSLDHRQQQRRVRNPRTMAIEALAFCDGEYDALEYSRTMSSHLALAGSHEATVNGSNGEICKGYWWELLMPHIGSKGHFDSRLVAQRRFLADTTAADLMAGASAPLADHFAGIIDRANAPLAGYPNTALMDNVYLTLRMQRWQGRIASSTDRIWPCISPFMFRRVMETALAAPPRVRVRHRMTRRLIERLNPRLAALPLAQGYPALPLRPTTAHRFWPLLVEVTSGAKRRLRRYAGRPAQSTLTMTRDGDVSTVVEYGAFRDLLIPAQMRTAHLYERGKLTKFLAAAGTNPAVNEPRLGRILTLEMLARRIEDCVRSGRQRQTDRRAVAR